MKHRLLISILSFIITTNAFAQIQRVYGKVTHDGQPLAKANVVEVDANHRYLGHTTTDENGLFTLALTGEKTSIRVTSEGMVRYTRKIGNQENWTIELEKMPESEKNKKIKATYDSNKLLAGIANGHFVPQLIQVQMLSDTTFCLVIPVRVYSSVDSYAQGRKVVIQNYSGKIVATAYCVEDAVAEEGTPHSWDPHVRPVMAGDENFTVETREYFCYPRFVFTKTEMEYLIDHSKELSCFAVDTARGDNYWMFYPAKSFAKEMQKILNRMLR